MGKNLMCEVVTGETLGWISGKSFPELTECSAVERYLVAAGFAEMINGHIVGQMSDDESLFG
jgi:hypothetical protein